MQLVKNISIPSYSVCLYSSNSANSVKYKYRFSLLTVSQKHFYFKLFDIVKQFKLKQVYQIIFFKNWAHLFSLALTRYLKAKTVNSKPGLVLFNPYIGSLSSATTSGQSGPGSDGNKEFLRIPQSPSITGTSPSDCLVSYIRKLVGWGS